MTTSEFKAAAKAITDIAVLAIAVIIAATAVARIALDMWRLVLTK